MADNKENWRFKYFHGLTMLDNKALLDHVLSMTRRSISSSLIFVKEEYDMSLNELKLRLQIEE